MRLALPDLGGGVGGGRWWMSVSDEGRKQEGKGEVEWWWDICVFMRLELCARESNDFEAFEGFENMRRR